MTSRIPLRQAIQALKTGEGSAPLPSAVRSLKLRHVARNAPSGPRDFAKTIAPRIAYANPSLPFTIERIRDPRSKSLDDKSPDAGATWDGEAVGVKGVPEGELIVELADSTKKIPLGGMTASQILKALQDAAGAPAETMAGQPGEMKMHEALAQGADTTYADIGGEPLPGSSVPPAAQ